MEKPFQETFLEVSSHHLKKAANEIMMEKSIKK